MSPAKYLRKRKGISKSLESLNSQKYGYDHLYSEPHDEIYTAREKRKRKGLFSWRKRGGSDYESFPKQKGFFSFTRKKSRMKKANRERKAYLDARDCNREDSFKSSFQDLCQRRFESAKRTSRTVYNKLRYGYDYSSSFATVVYSDRYFRYRLVLDTKIMPSKCFASDDLGAPVLYKKFTNLQKNHLDLFIDTENRSRDDMTFYTRHYMPIYTAWALRPHQAGAGPLQAFAEGPSQHMDRRFYDGSIFEELQMLYEKSRRVDANYRPLYDMLGRCREIMDYDGRHAHARKLLQPLIYIQHRNLSYRQSDIGYERGGLSDYEIQKRRKKVKKELYQPMKGKTEVSKFILPDFALSEDQLLMRKKGSLYEKIKCEPEKIYDRLLKESPRISAANLAHADLQSIKNIDKTYSTRKVLNTEVRRRSASIDKHSTSKTYYNNGRSASLKFDKNEPKLLPQLPNLDRNNMILMEPLLLMQTLNEDRQKRRLDTAIKNQKIIVRTILTYSTIIYILSLITFYFFSLS